MMEMVFVLVEQKNLEEEDKMITPCCKKEVSEDWFWNEIDISGDTMGVTNKSINCPVNCGKRLTVYLNIESVEVEE